MSLCKLLQDASPAKPTYVLATVQADFAAKDGSSELSVRLGDDVYLMFSIDGWAFATDLRDGKRRGYVPLNFCKAVEDFYVPTGESTPVTSAAAAAATPKRQQRQPPPQPMSRHLAQPSELSAVVKTCRIRNLSDRSGSSSSSGSSCGGGANSPPFDTVSCSSLEVSEIEADAESPCPPVCSPSFSCSSSSRDSTGCRYPASSADGRLGTPATAAASSSSSSGSQLVGRLGGGGLSVSEHSAFRRPATVAGCERVGVPSPDTDAGNDCRCGPPPALPPAPSAAGRYTKSVSSRLARPRFLSVDAGVGGPATPATASAKDQSGWSPIRPLQSADCKDGGSGRQSTSDEGYNSLVKYADTDAWREPRCDSSCCSEDERCDAVVVANDDDLHYAVSGGDDALSLTYSTDYDSL